MQEDKTERTPSQETKEDSQTAVQVKLKDIFRDFRRNERDFRMDGRRRRESKGTNMISAVFAQQPFACVTRERKAIACVTREGYSSITFR